MLTVQVLLIISLSTVGRASENGEPVLYYYGIVSIVIAIYLEEPISINMCELHVQIIYKTGQWLFTNIEGWFYIMLLNLRNL